MDLSTYFIQPALIPWVVGEIFRLGLSVLLIKRRLAIFEQVLRQDGRDYQ